MQSASNVEQSSAAQVLTKLFELMNQNDQTWEDFYAEDAVFESPYAPRLPGRPQGKAAICSFIKNALLQILQQSFNAK